LQDKPVKQQRRSIRLKGYDYRQASAYFVTICTKNRACLFGVVANGEIQLNDVGRIIQVTWNELPGRFPNLQIDEFIVMPNHIHGILIVGRNLLRPLVGTARPPQCKAGRDKSRPYIGRNRAIV
jgi:putative transposase